MEVLHWNKVLIFSITRIKKKTFIDWLSRAPFKQMEVTDENNNTWVDDIYSYNDDDIEDFSGNILI